MQWLLLIHQIPPKPDYLRVKIRRQLHKLGSVLIKNSVYVLPRNDQAIEDFQWLAEGIRSAGGEAILCAADWLDGLTDDETVSLFHRERNDEYSRLAREADQALRDIESGAVAEDKEKRRRGDAVKLRRFLNDQLALDFFDAKGKLETIDRVERLEEKLKMNTDRENQCDETRVAKEDYQNRTWVTRSGVFVDRIASAWLIRRFIDSGARFKFAKDGYARERGDVRFDMYSGEFTHLGDLCTFEVLIRRFDLRNPALDAIAEIVHDLDLKDATFDRPETAGVYAVLHGLRLSIADDETRVAQGSILFDALYSEWDPSIEKPVG